MNAEEGATTGGVGILLDAENIVIQARHDESCRLKDLAVLDLVINQALSGIAKDSRLIRAEAAVSVPLSGECRGSQKRYGIPKDTVRIVQHLIDCRFTSVALVQQGADSADWQIYRSGIAMASDERIDKVILCTGDGGKPFVKLVDALLQSKKSVELVAYDKIAQTMKATGLPCFFIAPAAHLASAELAEKKKEGEASSAIPIAEAEPGNVILTTEDAAQKKRTHVFRDVLKKIAEHSDDPKDEAHRKLRLTIWQIVREAPKDKFGSFSQHRLIDMALNGMRKEITEEEAREIVFELCDHTDLFTMKKKFCLNLGSTLLKNLKPI